MAVAPGAIRAPAPASTRATRTVPPRALRALFLALEEWVTKQPRRSSTQLPPAAGGLQPIYVKAV